MRKLSYFLVTFFIIIGFIACSTAKSPVSNNIIEKPKVTKQEAYNTTTLLFYSNHDKKVIEKVIKIPKEIPMNFTENLAYNEVFPWDKYICEIRFSKSKNSLPFYSIFAFYNYSKILAISKVDEEKITFWAYNKDGNPIKATIKEFKKALEVIEIKPTDPV